MALPVNVSGIRRNIKNIAHNYTDAQVKVREATSNDPWGPSSTIMSEIADLTYNVVAFSEIMQMVWKRLNDHGKNWRHVYKALVLLEYLIKTGSEKVADQSRENLHSISTLKDFQYIEEGKDQGINVREKAKSMVALLKDDERLKSERVRALKAKERFAQSVSGIASDAEINSPTSPTYHDTFVTSSSRAERESFGVREQAANYGELESARPHTVGEEELQLQLAIAMSKEEADNEEARRRSDDVRLQMALNESKDETTGDEMGEEKSTKKKTGEKSGINDLLDINFNPPQNNSGLGAAGGLGSLTTPSAVAPASSDPWGLPPPAPSNGQLDPWGSTPTTSPPLVAAADPWSPPTAAAAPPPVNDPWAAPSANSAAPADPWAPVKSTSPIGEASAVDPFMPAPPQDDFALLSVREKPANNGSAFALAGLDAALPPLQPGNAEPQRASPAKSRSPAAFLGENSNLVNLDNLVAAKTTSSSAMGTASSLSNSSPNLNALLNATNCSFPTSELNSNSFASSTNNLNNNNSYNPFGVDAIPPPSHTPSYLAGANPFNSSGPGLAGGPVAVPNPFQAAQAPKPSINQLRANNGAPSNPWGEASEPVDPFML